MYYPKYSLTMVLDSIGTVYAREEPLTGETRLINIGSLTKQIDDDSICSIGALTVTLDASGDYSYTNPRWMMSNIQLEGSLCSVTLDLYEYVMAQETVEGGTKCSSDTAWTSGTLALRESKIIFSGFIEGPVTYNDADVTVSFTISTLPLSNNIGLKGSKIW